MSNQIKIINAHQNNLKNLDVSINTREITVITGVSGSGKSSLAFDTLYAEGQRKYVETFSPYARQFLDRMDKPQVDRIEGVLPAIAIDQINPVKNSRSTVGTMTELNDHIKILFTHGARLFCQETAEEVTQETTETIIEKLQTLSKEQDDPRMVVTFPVNVPYNFTEEEILDFLQKQGYTRIQDRRVIEREPDPNAKGKKKKPTKQHQLFVIQDRFRLSRADQDRVAEAVETALRHGQGFCTVYTLDSDNEIAESHSYSTFLHSDKANISYSKASPGLFSFNSPVGACETCKGFGRNMSIDFNLVIPDGRLTLAEGAVKPMQTPTYYDSQKDLLKYAKKSKVRTDVPWNELTKEEQHWVIEGDPDWGSKSKPWDTQWYGVRRFFIPIEKRAYKMHIRMMLSKFRSFSTCHTCQGSRLKPEGNLWRLGNGKHKDYADGRYPRFMPINAKWSRETLNDLPGLCIYDLQTLPLKHVKDFFEDSTFDKLNDKSCQQVLKEIRARLKFLCDAGLGYLNLDRQSRTLSGGEVQRINLTTALGTSLVNTLFVLDEPSIGLHPHDMNRIVEAMERLRNAGNTLVVVEHDPQVMVAADRILEIGPGAGEKGGEIVFDGTVSQLRSAHSLTGGYLSGRLKITPPKPMGVNKNTPRLLLEGVTAHNLQNVDVSFPLNRLVCVTGVSGSGKSTLIEDVLYPALLKEFGKSASITGSYKHLLGAEQFSEVVMVDQSPIGKTARSNPASYVDAFTAIRKLFEKAPLSVERGYTAGTFSFNSGDGRCPVCKGTGFEHVEMQFLSDVYLRCPECDGKRFRDEVCEVKLEHLDKQASIDEVLEMTVAEAAEFFKGLKQVQTALQPLLDVGLEYVKLGQPVPTLSGGEAQRLKLAGHLAEAARSRLSTKKTAFKGSLFLFDEPTTGLHFDDIVRLMQAFRKLLDAGHSLIIIEHNLDLIRSADWLIEMGPYGGEDGGRVVAQGTPDKLKDTAESLTGKALLEYEQEIIIDSEKESERDQDSKVLKERARAYTSEENIAIVNAYEHNLKNVDVHIPRNKFTVITGVSGSGKSTLAFDILFNEGQRRYLESLNAYARSIVQPAGQPDVDAIYGIPPTVAIEQRTSRGGYKSTVGTMTEVHHFLRLLYVKLGQQYCPDCMLPVQPQSAEEIEAGIYKQFKGQHVTLFAPLIRARKGYYTDLAKWAGKKGYETMLVDGEIIPLDPWPRLDRFKEHTIELPVGSVELTPKNRKQLAALIDTALEYGKGLLNVAKADGTSDPELVQFSSKRVSPVTGRSFPELDPRLFSYNSSHGWCPDCFGTGLVIKNFDEEQTGEEKQWSNAEQDQAYEVCPSCHGTRLNEVARHVFWKDLAITDISQMTIQEAGAFFEKLKLDKRSATIARDIVQEIRNRLSFLQEVGLQYLTLDRAAPTLSGGEAQRIRLAAQLGSNLQGVCYVLDEPTIGLHPRDNRILLNALDRLESNGNTLVVVEHDEDTIRRAQHIIDIGPGAGIRGGQVVAQGSYKDIIGNQQSATGRYLSNPIKHPVNERRGVSTRHDFIKINKASLHNLRNTNARIPLNRLTVVTGVSGSGKSSLARDVLLANLQQATKDREFSNWQGCSSIKGWEQIDRVLEVDQTPIGKTPRSCPATYIGFWDDIRRQFANSKTAKLHGWTASRFSFNTGEGRCPVCEGQGMRTVEMSFMPDVKVPCEACEGARFNPETLSVELRGKNISDVLHMEVDDAIPYFENHPKVLRALTLLQDVGLGYLTLGQPSPTLSGGEAQRIKLITELVKAKMDQIRPTEKNRALGLSHTLYVLDEPTVGLSMADVEKLCNVLHRLVDAGNTVVVIEHNLDVMAEADWIIDMGPEGGDQGGKVVASGSPEQLIKKGKQSHTAEVLDEFMKGEQPADS